jgi:hypothetical protein
MLCTAAALGVCNGGGPSPAARNRATRLDAVIADASVDELAIAPPHLGPEATRSVARHVSARETMRSSVRAESGFDVVLAEILRFGSAAWMSMERKGKRKGSKARDAPVSGRRVVSPDSGSAVSRA